ncbi:DNRLRE domain-containing protein [Nonomuraea basaltis]|uniref:DNRLRE domain-containing protein n=1 Tax=Nonomuraea basaltis TaxID=2495887 RepID=UPI00110C6DA3|nr:LamG-like jellyroll fold domain-containing protein [Nonomuraea basaltis]TMR92540.1 DNRLRE domain-containing protein [Nonomuraea basaltis]
MPYQDTDPTGAEIDANTSSDPNVRPAPEVTDDQATAMRADSPGYYMEDTTYGFGIPEEVTEQEWLDGMEATYPIGDGTDPDPGSDTTPPTVTSTVPADAATGVPINIPIRAIFSEPVTEVQAAVKTSGGTSVAGTVAMDTAGTAMTFRPQQQLSADTAYTVEVSGAKDAAGNRMAAHSWSFTTEHGPQALWKFDEGTGRAAADSSGNGNDAVVSESTFWVPGKHGTALSSMTTPVIKTPATSANETSERLRFLAVKEAARQSKPVEVAHETLETSITHAMPDGSFRTDITAGPVRTLKDGVWIPIDTSLIEEGGALKPKAIATGVALEISTGGTKPYAKITHRQGEKSALSWPTALPKPTVKGNVATFANAAGSGADLVITVLPTGLQQMVVLRERPEKPLELRISVAGNAALSESKDGRLLLAGKNKKLVASAPQPFMWDASAKERPQSAKRVKIATDVVTKDDHTELVLKPHHRFLTDPDTTYPVRLQPLATSTSSEDVSLASTDTVDSPAYPDGSVMIAGVQTGQKLRSYLRFPTGSLQGQTVTDAKLSLYNITSSACGASVSDGLQVRRVTGTWDVNNLYWANKPTATTEDAQINKAGYDLACADGAKHLERNVTGIAQDWAAGAADHGLVVQSPTESTAINWRYLTASEDTEFNQPPTLTVTTSGPVSAPTVSGLAIAPAQDVTGVTVATSLTPQLAATVADTIGGDLTGEFEIEHDPAATGQGTGQIWAGASLAVASGSQAAVNVPAGKLSDGWKIRWRARAVNAAAASTSPWSDWQSVTVDVTGTAKTSLAQSAGPVLRTDQSFTVGAWLRWTSTDAAYSVLEQKGSNTTPFRLGNDPQHGLVFTLGRTDENGTTAEGALSGVKPPVNEWFHLAGVYDSAASKVTLYLNGAEIKNAPISFPAWNATGPMLLGADMVGDLDEVFAYQKALSADQIGMLHTAATSVKSTTTAKTTTKPLNTTAAAKKFPYGHISTDECRRVRPVAPSAVATTGSFSLCYSYLVGERDIKGPPGAQWEAGRWTAHMVIVVHSYVGHMIGKANEYQARPSDVPIGRTLASRKIRMQIQMGPVSATGSFLDDWDDRWMRVYSGAAGCTADANDGAHKTVEDWAEGGIHEVILDRTSDDNSHDADKKSSCTINPNVRYTTHAFWVRKDLENPHTFRCDSSRSITFYSSGCVLSTLRPVLIFDENNANEFFAARHVWTALYDQGITYPKVGSGPAKKIPGGFIPHAPSCANLCLRRSTSKAVEKANRYVAISECRKIRPYVKPDSCDEYPFATTLQGAGQQNTGYNYSVAIIPETQNCSQGATINQWYQRNRILDLDSFWVDVVRLGYNRPHSGAPGTVAHDPAPTSISLATCTIDGVS